MRWVWGVAAAGLLAAGVALAQGIGPPPASSSAAPSGAAGGDLSGTYPDPTVAKLNGVAASSYGRLDAADQTLSGGANVTFGDLGTKTSGTTTIDCGTVPLQYVRNNGAFVLAAPAADGSCILQVKNGAAAGTITFSGFSVGSNTGDTMNTTSTSLFSISIWRVNGTAGYRIAAHQ